MPIKQLSLEVNKEVQMAARALAPALKRLTKSLKTLQPKQMPIGALADSLYDLRQLSKLLSTLTEPFRDVLDSAEALIEEHFIKTLEVGESSGVQGRHSRVQVTDTVIPVAKDWPKIYAYIRRYNAFELLGRKLKSEAVQERWTAKKEVPGVGKFHNKRVSCTKLGGKK